MKENLEQYTRRRFLGDVTTGLMGVGLSHLLGLESLHGQTNSSSWQPGKSLTHHKPRAKRVLQIFCPGAASQIDLWEHKPLLQEYDGKPLPGEEDFMSFQGKNGTIMGCPWEFKPAGRSGKMISSMLPHLSQHVDDMAFFHAMQSKSNTHGPAPNGGTGTPIVDCPWARPTASKPATRSTATRTETFMQTSQVKGRGAILPAGPCPAPSATSSGTDRTGRASVARGEVRFPQP